MSPDLIQCIFFLLILSLCIIEKRVMPMRDTSPMLVNNDYRAPPTRPARPARRPHAPNPCCAGRPVGEDLRSGLDVPVVHSHVAVLLQKSCWWHLLRRWKFQELVESLSVSAQRASRSCLALWRWPLDVSSRDVSASQPQPRPQPFVSEIIERQTASRFIFMGLTGSVVFTFK